ncbi:amidohydrolase family protein [Aggregicoccus sp. 17bor-14]|uniref:amidohydrolase family protein n=1 Tax=Myxococcaceae TaxID=31 RepID=UPI00129C8908|nr:MULTISPECIES: amidohydrolase family protein [Myxococcaceae]MBF5042651.1 amidohydrolase family protein [Simulacricoccus sp. 17bor-14]MRI88419.1 amidohydrolase family protein [Aggregicoccus sp. 17bor-14]
MEGRLLLKNCALFRADGRVRRAMAVVVEEGRIHQVAPDAEVPVRPGDWEVACRGRLLAPGLVDCHSHLVSSQLLPPTGELLLKGPAARRAQQARLEALLTPADVEALSAFGLARALRSGVTLAVEHLACPSDVGGALAAQARAAERLGMRLVTGPSTHSLGGAAAAEAQVEANAAFARAQRSHPRVRGALGFHASSSCEDALLRRLGRLREELGAPLVFHLAEDEADLTATFSRYGRRVVARLETFGLLGAGSLAAHGRALDRAESERLAQGRTFLALAPTAGLVQEPGGGGLDSLLARPQLLGLGSAGYGHVSESLQAAFVLLLQQARAGRLLDPDGTLAQLAVEGPAELCSMLFGAPSGAVEEGALADLVVYDLVPTEDPATGLMPSPLLALARSPVAWSVVDGRVTVREGQLLGADFLELAHAAARALEGLWARAQ